MIQVLRVAPLHPLLTWRPTALSVLIDFLQIELCLLQVAGKPITIPEIDLHIANNFRVANGVRCLSALAIVAQGTLEVIELPIDPAQAIEDTALMDFIAEPCAQLQAFLQRPQRRLILPLPTTGQAKTQEAPQQEVLQVVRATNGGTLLEQAERRLVLPLPVVEYPELDEGESFKRFVSGLTADA